MEPKEIAEHSLIVTAQPRLPLDSLTLHFNGRNPKKLPIEEFPFENWARPCRVPRKFAGEMVIHT